MTISQATFIPEPHRHRALIDAETHARPVDPIVAPVRVRRAAFMPDGGPGSLAVLEDAINAWGDGGRTPKAFRSRQVTRRYEGRTVTVELHNEFATITWISAPDDWQAWPGDIGLELCAGLKLIAATRIDVTDTPAIGEAALVGFSPLSLCYSRLFGGQVEAATDFVIDADGYTRFEVAAKNCGELRRGVLVRRLLEIETYRCLALLGLPMAREKAPRINAQESRLTAIMQEISQDASAEDTHGVLDALHGLSLEVGQTVEDTSFRFAASRAYAGVLASRLERLEETPIGEFTTIARYLDNRVGPAIATCTAIEKRLDGLTLKLQRSTELLNARISLGIETQNRTVLDTISRTARSQYRLQQTVEGLSIIAISYYALAILGYILEGLHEFLPLEKPVMLAAAAPVVVLIVWSAIRRLRGPRAKD